MQRMTPYGATSVGATGMLASLALLALAAPPSPAQQRILVSTERPPALPQGQKLAPELDAMRQLRLQRQREVLRLLGVTTRGELVFSLARGERFDGQLRAAIENVPGIRRARLGPGAQFTPIGELLVTHSLGKPPAAQSLLGFDRVRPGLSNRLIVLRIGATFESSMLDTLAGDQNVTRVEPNYPFRLATAPPGDPLYGDQWGMHAVADPPTWPGPSADPIVVAVIDTGIDENHPDLEGRIWSNPDETEGMATIGIDDGLNSYLDDFHGYDFADLDNDPNDEDGHGTMCAGIIAAIRDNDQGVAGLARNVRIMPLKILDNVFDDANASEIVAAIYYAVDSGADIISCSFAGPSYSEAVDAAVESASTKGILVVCAAGNGGGDVLGDDNDVWPQYPASLPHANVVSVLAVGPDDERPFFSNYGAVDVDLGAPGVAVWSTTTAGEYDLLDGTSAATPFVAGAAALAMDHPSLAGRPAHEVKDAILARVRPLVDLDDKCVSRGMLHLGFLTDTAAPEPTPDPILVPQTSGESNAPARPATDMPADQTPSPADANSKAKTTAPLEAKKRPGVPPQTETGPPPPEPGEPRRQLHGKLAHGVFTTGGETTGTHLHTEDGVVQLDFSGVPDLKDLLTKLDGKTVTVIGTLEIRKGVVVRERRVVVVDSLQIGRAP